MEMLLTGDMVRADDALRMGLVNAVVPRGRRAGRGACAWAANIASKSAPVMKLGKQAFYEQAEMRRWKQAYAHAAAVMAENMLARDAEEGIGAFLDKREPVWEADARAAMNHDSYPDDLIRGILNTVKSIALVGASRQSRAARAASS